MFIHFFHQLAQSSLLQNLTENLGSISKQRNSWLGMMSMLILAGLVKNNPDTIWLFSLPNEPTVQEVNVANLLAEVSVDTTSPGQTDEFCYRILYRNASVTEHSYGAYIEVTLPLGVKTASLPGVGGNVKSVSKNGDPATGVYVRVNLASSGQDYLEAGSSGVIDICGEWTCIEEGAIQSPAVGSKVNFVTPLVFKDDANSVTAVDPDSLTVAGFKTCPPPPTYTSSFKKEQIEGYLMSNPGGAFDWRIRPESPFEDQMEYIELIPEGLDVYNFYLNRKGWQGWTISCDCGDGFIPIYEPDGLKNRWINEWVHAQAWKPTFPNLLGSDDSTDTGCDAIYDAERQNYRIQGLEAIKWTTADTGFYGDKVSNQIVIYTFVDEDAEIGSTINNCAEANNLSKGTQFGTSCEEITIVEEPFAKFLKTRRDNFGTDNVSALNGYSKQMDDIVFELNLTYYTVNGYSHTGFTITDTLEPGLTYISSGLNPNWYAVTFKNGFSGLPDPLNPKNQPGCMNPIFSKEYLPDGRTVLKWEFPACTLPKGYTMHSNTTLKIYYTARYDRTIELPFDRYYTYAAADFGKSFWESRNKGRLVNTSFDYERFTLGKPSSFSAAGAVESRKWVKGSEDTGYSRYPNIGSTNTNGEGEYQILVSNLSNEALSRIDIVDILPHQGDQSLLSGQDRESTWSTELSQELKVEILDNTTNSWVEVPSSELPFGIMYAQTHSPCYLDDGGSVRSDISNANLPAGCSDFDTYTPAAGATAFSLRWENTSSPLQFGQELRITAYIQQVGGEIDPASGEVAWNSFGYTVTQEEGGDLLSSEPIKVGMQMVNTANTAKIQDYVYYDNNVNGIKDEGEDGVEGITVGLFTEEGETVETAGNPYTRVTDSSGAYSFVGLDSNTTYVTALTNPTNFETSGALTGYSIPSTSDANYEEGQYNTDVTTGGGGTTESSSQGFGFVQLGSIGNLVWLDNNKDGIQDAGEPGFEGVKVFLYTEAGSLQDSTTTDANGLYGFADKAPGNYYLKFANIPADTVFTFKGAGSSYALDSDAKADGTTEVFTVRAPDHNYVYMDAGLIPNPTNPASIQGMVWDELGTSNGIYEAGESVLSGFTVNLLDADQNLLAIIETDSLGAYEFAGLDPALDYYIQFIKPGSSTFANAGADMDADQNGLSNLIDLEASETRGGLDAGIQGLFSIGNHIWADANGNGFYDSEETGMSGISVYLKNTTGTYLDTTISDANGKYVFKGLNPETYIVEVAIPSGYKSTADISSSASPNQADKDDNGVGEVVSGLVASNTIVLEASAGSASDANHNESDHGELINGESDVTSNPKAYYTVDFGFRTLPLTETNCKNGIDDDGDGFIDCDDPDCQLSLNAGTDKNIPEGSSTTILSSVSGGDGNYTYSWTPPTGLSASNIAEPVASPPSSTTYSLTVTDGANCSATDQVSISLIAPPIAQAGNDVALCAGASTVLNGSATEGSGGYSYSWSPTTGLSATNVANPTASPTSTTTYTLTITDGMGTTDTDEVQVIVNPALSADAGNDINIDFGNSAKLNGSARGGDGNYRYAWSPTRGLTGSNLSAPLASPNSSISYTLVVTDGIGCSARSEVRIIVESAPVNPGGIGLYPNIWLDASAGVETIDGKVATWTSQATEGGDCSQRSASSRPGLTVAGLNYRPTISFDGSDDRLITADAHGAITTDYHFFLVMNKLDEKKYQTLMAYQKDDWGLLHSYGESGGNNAYTVYSHSPPYWRWNRDGTHPISSTPQLLTASFSNTGGIAYYADGESKGSHDITPTLSHLPEGSRLVLGCRGVNGSTTEFDAHYQGDIAEVIFFNEALSESERQKIQTYLAIKYGISLTHDYIASDGTVVWDYSSMTAYNHAIVGIGKDLVGNLYQKQSKSVEPDVILSIAKGSLATTHEGNNGIISDDETFLLAGSNNGSLLFDNGSITGPSGYPCLNRVWKSVKTGDVGNVSLSFDLSNFSGANYALIVDTDGDGAFNDETPNTQAVYGTGRITFENIALNSGALFSLVEIPSLVDCSLSFSKVTNSGIEADAESSWGASWVDYDDDGDMDLFVPDYAFWQSSRMYQNNGDGTFSNTAIGQATTDKGSNVGAQWADYDNDGDIDLLAANVVQAPNRIYNNDGGVFSRIDAGPVNNYTGYNHAAQWVDVNNDGNLDVFVADYMPSRFNNVYLGDGLGGFRQIQSAISQEALPSMQGVWGDYDGDGLQDLFVANTWGNDNSLFHNDGNGNFSKITTGTIATSGGSSLSAAWADYDNDGDLDLYVANTSGQKDFLYRNEGSNGFVPVSGPAITEEELSSQGGVWGDLDNDGDLDLIVVHDNNEPVSIFLNNGNGGFTLNSTDPLAQDKEKSGSAALADYDNDGDLDVFVAHLDNTADVLFANQTHTCSNHWKKIKLQGTISNRSGLGAKIFVKANINNRNIWQLREVSSLNGGISAQSSIKAHFGLGNATSIDSVKIEWPSGTIQYLTNVDVDNEQLVIEPADAMFKVITFVDLNGNCTYDNGDVYLPNVEINIQGKAFTAVTDSAGSVSFNTELGTYLLDIEEQNGLTHTCWSNASVNAEAPQAGSATANSTLYLAFEADDNNPDMEVTLATTAMRRGMGSNFTITYYNDGMTPAENVELAVTFDADVIPRGADIPWNRIDNGDTYVWILPAVNPFETVTINLTDSISAEAVLGRITNTVATCRNIPTDANPDNNTDSELEPITAPIDPNDIQVSPEGNTDPEETLIYRIRFQNVGTFLTENIMIRDTLPKELDPGTFKVVKSSHRNRTRLSEEGILEAYFNYIMLPDSTTNEPASHGYLEFEVKPRKGVDNGSILRNKAAIYFDAEKPVLTNTVTNVIVYDRDYDVYDEMEEMTDSNASTEEEDSSPTQQATAQQEGGESAYLPVMQQANGLFVIVSPNPVSARADIRYLAPQYEKVTMRVVNSLGQVMYEEDVVALSGITTMDIYTQNWPPGYYYVQLMNKKSRATFKFIKE